MQETSWGPAGASDPPAPVLWGLHRCNFLLTALALSSRPLPSVSSQRGRVKVSNSARSLWQSINPKSIPSSNTHIYAYTQDTAKVGSQCALKEKIGPFLNFAFFLIWSRGMWPSPRLQIFPSTWKKVTFAMAGVAQLVGRHPTKWRVTGWSPSQGTCLGCRFSPRSWWEATTQCFSLTLMFLSLSLSLPLPLS